MEPIFKLHSGVFMGWRDGDEFFSSNGNRAGRFIGDKLYQDNGVQVGWVHPSHRNRVGRRNLYTLSSTGSRGMTTQKVTAQAPKDLAPIGDAAWSDPNPI